MTALRTISRSLSLLVLVVVLLPAVCRASGAEFEAGMVTGQVVALSKANFKLAIQDPANSFWFLKFYAPW